MTRGRFVDPEAGFSLIELLVVMFIIGLLAAIALPAFLNQRGKADDANAKEIAHSAVAAMEICATQNDGSYDKQKCKLEGLREIEDRLPGGAESPLTVNPGGDRYSIEVTAERTGNVFSVERDAAGRLSFPCTVAGSNNGGCQVAGEEGVGTWGG
jgi:type IV pilus assembly protein PilA